MSREEKVKCLIELIDQVEGVKVAPDHFVDMSDEQLEEEIEWYDYLMTK
ncbi:hypothetical protein [Bacillus cereus]|nr:hypothetical protein [Bacillus cereus]